MERLPVWSDFHAASRYYPEAFNVVADDQTVVTLQEEVLHDELAEIVEFQTRESPSVTTDFFGVLARRLSTRSFAPRAVPKSVVDEVVQWAFVGADTRTDRERARQRRPTPSAGALFPVEIYLLSIVVEGLMSGVYHLSGHPRQSEKTWRFLGDIPEGTHLNRALNFQLPPHAAGILVLSALITKSTAKYGERGYRFCLLEAGHIGQNLNLCLEAFGLGSLCVGGFADSILNRLLGIDGFDEAALYAVPFGAKLER